MESQYGLFPLRSSKDWVFGYSASSICLRGRFEGPLNLWTPTPSHFCVVKLGEWASGMCDSSWWKRWAESWHFSFPSTSVAAYTSHLNTCHSHSVIDYKGVRVSICTACYLVCSIEFNMFGGFKQGGIDMQTPYVHCLVIRVQFLKHVINKEGSAL